MEKRVFGPEGKGGVRRAIVLPWSKSLEISFKSLRVRFFRSMITVSSLVLAVSFLSFVLSSLNVAEGVLASGGADAAKRLLDAGYDVQVDAGTVAMTPKERWIVFLSMLVCAVGIVNAQLMSVTERFREIGVMKCLGALDAMVLRLFLLEAAMQGLAGSLAGALLGALFASLTGWIRFGWDALAFMPASGFALSVAISVGGGLMLSLAGVLYPAVVAARMRPINAIRAEH
ncbi:ABC transporter permease [Salidesulfovibrio brasiliensis]|uniref:ABC transporter permease n=1 Tax=Salidesulfovibrio brasiliensis TaxID=221711 RepID=UPI0006D197FE|nr:FtsX-like permease family protein [Salidesulfovibrio brasiliensis]